MAESAPQDRFDTATRVIALLVLALGIVLLVTAFNIANDAFAAMAKANEAWTKMQPASVEETMPMASVVGALGGGAVRVAVLFAMAYIASLIASKGIQLYAAARGKQ